MMGRKAIHLSPAMASWAMRIIAMIVWASNDVEASGATVMRRENNEFLTPSVGGGLETVRRHGHTSALELGDTLSSQEEEDDQEENAELEEHEEDEQDDEQQDEDEEVEQDEEEDDEEDKKTKVDSEVFVKLQNDKVIEVDDDDEGVVQVEKNDDNEEVLEIDDNDEKKVVEIDDDKDNSKVVVEIDDGASADVAATSGTALVADSEIDDEDDEEDDDVDDDTEGDDDAANGTISTTQPAAAADADGDDDDDKANGANTTTTLAAAVKDDDGDGDDDDDTADGATTTTTFAAVVEDDDFQVSSGINSLSHHVREETYYGRCPCNKGIEYINFWANARATRSGGPPRQGQKFKVRAGKAPVFTFDIDVSELTIQCGGSAVVGRINVSAAAGQPVSVLLEVADNNSDHRGFCGDKAAGFVTVNSWRKVSDPTGPVFVSGTEGFSCFKSPQLLRLKDGAVLAFAQAFWPSCTESAHSTIVFRRSEDQGVSWSPLAQLVEIDDTARNRLGLCGKPLSMSNVVPIELDADSHYPGRVMVLYMRNNYRTWAIRSNDGGKSWSGDREIPTATPAANAVQSPDCGRTIDWFRAGPGPFSYMKEFGAWLIGMCWYQSNNPYTQASVAKRLETEDWQWVGIGPGGAIQLRTGAHKGRILVPGYHSFIRNLDPKLKAYNPTAHFWRNTAETHTLVSDDGGETWELAEGLIGESMTSRETNFFQLSDGSVYANSATLALGTPQFRTQAKVRADVPAGGGVKLEELRFTEIPQPLGGCQGAAAADEDDAVYVSGPNGPVSKAVKALEDDVGRCAFNSTGRSGLTVWRSFDVGQTFSDSLVVDTDLSADSSIQVQSGTVWVLYEQADDFPAYEMKGQRRHLNDMQIFDPDRIMFTTLHFPHTTTTTTEATTAAPAVTVAPATTTAPASTASTTAAPATTSTASSTLKFEAKTKIKVEIKKQ